MVGANGDAPAISRRNPNENLFELGISGLSFGSYYGPGVPFKRFSTGNYIFLFKSFYHHK